VREEGEGVGCEQLEMAWVGGGVASACVVGVESTACVWVVRVDGWGDGSNRWGPRASERGRANGRSALTGGARCAERGRGAREGKRCQQGDPTGQMERGSRDARARAGADRRGPPVTRRAQARAWARGAGPNGLS
jgi:hypothetical protein